MKDNDLGGHERKQTMFEYVNNVDPRVTGVSNALHEVYLPYSIDFTDLIARIDEVTGDEDGDKERKGSV